MAQTILEALRGSLGIGVEGSVLGVGGIVLRTLIIYGFTLVLVRMGSRRFLGKASAFDFIVAIMLGSIMAGAIDGSGTATSHLDTGCCAGISALALSAVGISHRLARVDNQGKPDLAD